MPCVSQLELKWMKSHSINDTRSNCHLFANTCQHRASPEAVVVPDLYAQVCRKYAGKNYLGHVSSYDITLFWIRCVHSNPAFVSVCMWAHEYTCMYVHMCCREQRKISGVVPLRYSQSTVVWFAWLVGWLGFLSLWWWCFLFVLFCLRQVFSLTWSL